jgi:hypothetical protein
MLSPSQRAGVLAAVIALGLFLSGGAVVAMLAGKSEGQGGPNPPAGKPLADRPVSEGHKGDDVGYILGHRWWSKPPDRAGLDRIISLVIESNRGTAVLIDRTGQTGTSSQYDDRVGWMFVKPSVGRPRMVIQSEWATRPDREKVVRALREELDKAEYRDGPGR